MTEEKKTAAALIAEARAFAVTRNSDGSASLENVDSMRDVARALLLLPQLADALEAERINRECSDRRIGRLHADISATELGPLADRLDEENWGTTAGALRRAAAKILALEARTVWVVKFSNYDPAEIASIHASEETANAERDRRNALGDSRMWVVAEWSVEP